MGGGDEVACFRKRRIGWGKKTVGAVPGKSGGLFEPGRFGCGESRVIS